eukprot:Pgem_evm1s3568
MLTRESAHKYMKEEYEEGCNGFQCNCIALYFAYTLIDQISFSAKDKQKLMHKILKQLAVNIDKGNDTYNGGSTYGSSNGRNPYGNGTGILNSPNNSNGEIYDDGTTCHDSLIDIPLLTHINTGHGYVIECYSRPGFNMADMKSMVILIEKLATAVFKYDVKKLRIYNRPSDTIAYNSDGRISFNLYHWAANVSKAEDYWFMNFCHELAHNKRDNHGKLFSKEEEDIFV